MKGFYIAVCLFLAMLAASFINYGYIDRLAEDMIQSAEELNFSEGDISEAKQLWERWEQARALVQVTANHTEIEAISNALDELCVFAQYGNRSEFERARQILINTLEELRLSEVISFGNIL